MAGIVHEVENHRLVEQAEQEAAEESNPMVSYVLMGVLAVAHRKP